MNNEYKFYFDHGFMVNIAFCNNITKNLRYAEKTLNVKLVARDAWVQITGKDENCSRAKNFFEELAKICDGGQNTISQQDFEQVAKAFRDNKEKELRKLYANRIVIGPKRHEIVPRSQAQLEYLDAMQEKDLVFGIGPAGTGKTYLAMAVAIQELLHGHVQRLILTRPAREAGENLGFLPGSLEEKIMPYLRPLYDALYELLDFEHATTLIEKGIIEVAPLAFMRGRTLNNAFIILDEAQNTTKEQMLMFLTRLGHSSKAVVTGDPSQNDLKLTEGSGLKHAENTLKDISDLSFCYFDTSDVVRHAILEKIITAYTNV